MTQLERSAVDRIARLLGELAVELFAQIMRASGIDNPEGHPEWTLHSTVLRGDMAKVVDSFNGRQLRALAELSDEELRALWQAELEPVMTERMAAMRFAAVMAGEMASEAEAG